MRFAHAAAFALLLCGCGRSIGGFAPGAPAVPARGGDAVRATGKIAHIVIIVQENRSFDELFAGFPGADTVTFGYGHGKKYVLHPHGLADPWDVNHAHYQFLEDYDGGKNDGFDREIAGLTKQCPIDPHNDPACWRFRDASYAATAYSFVPRSQIAPYWTMARQYALSDRTFESVNGPSYPSHQYMIAGQSLHVIENAYLPGANGKHVPWGCDAPPAQISELLKYGTQMPKIFSPPTGAEVPGPFPCFTYPTAADLLDRAGISWSYYAPAMYKNGGDVWSAFDAIRPVRFGPDWVADVQSPETTIFSDVAGGRLRSVSWVVPSFVNSDHAGSRSLTGPQWVAAIVNAIGTSPYWKDTAIVVFWDDWGGWYDHVVPPQYADPKTGAYEGLGFRVPLIAISPYAKHGYVSHKQHEIASTLHFIETAFGLPSLGLADARADDLSDMFDFTQSPSRFKRIPAKLTARDFLSRPVAYGAPDY